MAFAILVTVEMSGQQWLGLNNTTDIIERSGDVRISNANLSLWGDQIIGYNTWDTFISNGFTIGHNGMTKTGNDVNLSAWQDLKFNTGGENRMTIINNGNIKFNHLPSSNFGSLLYWDWDGRGIEQFSSDGSSRMLRFKNSMTTGTGNVDGGFSFTDHLGTNVLRINNYRVGVGTNTLTEALTVNGKILAEEVQVVLDVPADYVFEKYYQGISELKPGYTMPTLEEIEAYTKANNHLPEMPSAQEIKDNGLELSKITNLLLQKIEELTLYTIEQEKRIIALESRKN
jgi:hypothetical protein